MIKKQRQVKSVLELLCAANRKIDEIARSEGKLPVARKVPIVRRNSLDHHVVALAGILKRTAADSISASVGGIIVEARRARPA